MPSATPTGLFDFQVNGFGGVDFQSDTLSRAELEHAVASMRQHGLAAIFLTLITENVESLCRRLEAIEKLRAASPAIREMVAGYHVEGPWLNPEQGYRGAHPADAMHAPSLAEYERLQSAAQGRVKLITLAPEWSGSAEIIAHIVRAGVHVSLGHTNASEKDIDVAIKAGARFCTHVGNGAPLQMHRHDNIIQRLLGRDELIACFIPDGVHLPHFVLKNFVRAKPRDRVLFTTDAMSGAGAGPGRYRIGRMEIDVGADGIARQPGGQGFAGSTLTPDVGVQRCADYLGITIEESTHLWSTAAAEAFGVNLPSSLSA